MIPPSPSVFSLEGNKFHGSLPIYENEIIQFSVGFNHFSGSIPSHVCKLFRRGIEVFSVRFNALTGTIPSCFFQSTPYPLVQEFDHNFFHGKLLIDDGNNNRKSLPFLRVLAVEFNFLTGPLPIQLLENHNLKAMLASSNCFTGNFLNYSCSNLQNRNVILLQLDALYSPQRCRPKNATFLAPFSISFHSFGGPLPLCLLSNFQTLKYLSMAGNGFTGSLPRDLQIVDGIQSLNLSHNRLVGEIPSWMQCRKFRSLDLSYNKLEGNIEELLRMAGRRRPENDSSWVIGLSGMTESVVEFEQLVLKHNRLSGRLFRSKENIRTDWRMLRNVSRLEVLEGNVFECGEVEREREGEEFRLAIENDWYESRYFCESSVVEVGLKAYGYLVGLAFIVILVIWLIEKCFKGEMSSKAIFTTLKKYLNIVTACSRWKGHEGSILNESLLISIATKENNSNNKFYRVFASIAALERVILKGLLTTCCLLVVVWPVLFSLHSHESNVKFEDVYGWTQSGLYLKGSTSGSAIMGLLVLLALPWIIFQNLYKQGTMESAGIKQNRHAIEAREGKREAILPPYNGWELKVLVGGMYVFVFIANAAMSMSVNMFYVSELNRHKENSSHRVIGADRVGGWLDGRMEIILLQIGLGLYNVVWNRYVLVLAIRFLKRMSLSEEGRVGGGRISWQYEYGLMLLLVNSVLGPWLSTLFKDENCMGSFVQAAFEIAYSSSNDIVTSPSARDCQFIYLSPAFRFCMIFESVAAPLQYSFQCSSRIFSFYLPVFQYYYAFSLIILLFYCFFDWRLICEHSNFRKTLLLIDYILLPDDRILQKGSRLKRRVSRQVSFYEKPLLVLISADEISRIWAFDATIIFAFGLHDPLRLGILVSTGMLLEGVKWKWLMFRYCAGDAKPSDIEDERKNLNWQKQYSELSNREIDSVLTVSSDSHHDNNSSLDVEEGVELLPLNCRPEEDFAVRRKSKSTERIDFEEKEDGYSSATAFVYGEEDVSRYGSLNEALGSSGEVPLYRWSLQVVLVGFLVNGLAVFDMIGEEEGEGTNIGLSFMIGFFVVVIIFLSVNFKN